MKVEDFIKENYVQTFWSGQIVCIEHKYTFGGCIEHEITIQTEFGDYGFHIVGVPYVEVGEYVECGDIIGTKLYE